MYKNILLWLVLGSVLASLFGQFNVADEKNEISYSQFIQSVKQGSVSSVKIAGSNISGVTALGERFETYSPGDLGLMGDLLSNGVSVEATPPAKESFVKQLIISLAPILLLIGVIMYTMRGAGGSMGGKNPMSFGKSKARLITKDESHVTFDDVAGVDEAKEEVGELVDFLSDPSKFTKVGGKIPKGVLMVGPPGTGKTLLAKAVAGEADVPFFFISGSDFVEMFVGVGASRVRDMFDQAKKNAPCIIFIDEIDAVGRQRGAGMGGGHDEREQTLNQMLVEMDGFEGSEGIIVVAATNRPDVLDPALLRPGRFDRTVTVGLPDINGRDAILKVHMRKLPIAKNVKSMDIARGTPGFSGADLANLANEAALIAARFSKKLVGMREFEKAKDKINCYSKKMKLLGDAGSGQLAKMVNQICIAGLVQGLSEAINFGMKAGLNMEDVIEVISKGAAQSWQMENRYKTMIDDKFDFGFAVDWMRKDLGIVIKEAKKNGSPVPITELIDGYYAKVQEMGGNRWDSSSLIALLKKKK